MCTAYNVQIIPFQELLELETSQDQHFSRVPHVPIIIPDQISLIFGELALEHCGCPAFTETDHIGSK